MNYITKVCVTKNCQFVVEADDTLEQERVKDKLEACSYYSIDDHCDWNSSGDFTVLDIQPTDEEASVTLKVHHDRPDSWYNELVMVEGALDDKQEAALARTAADFAGGFLMHRHRGVLNCQDRLVLFGNDGYYDDPRSKREVEILLDKLGDHDPVFGIDKEGCTWALVLTDYSQKEFDEGELQKLVWDAWMVACDEAMDKAEQA